MEQRSSNSNQPVRDVQSQRPTTESAIAPHAPVPGGPGKRRFYPWAPSATAVFKTRIPLLKHVPPRARTEVGRALANIINKIRAKMVDARHRFNLLRANESPMLLAFYLDDGVLVADHRVLAEICKYLTSSEPLAYGLHLKFSGTKVWRPRPPTVLARALYPGSIRIHTGPGVCLLGAPIGTRQFVRNFLQSKSNFIKEQMLLLKELNDAHVSFSLLRACFTGCKLNFLLRATPTELNQDAARSYDTNVQSVVRHLANGVLDPQTFAELQLPVAIADPNHPHFGAGLTSAVAISPAAYVASVTAAAHPAQQFMVNDGTVHQSRAHLLAHCNNSYAKSAYEALKQSTSDATRPSLDEIFTQAGTPQAHTQRTLTSLIHVKQAESIPEGTRRTLTYRRAQNLPGAKDWLKCRPAPGLNTHINDTAFRWWLSFYCRNQLPFGDACFRRGCTKPLDRNGDHLLFCPSATHHAVTPRNRRRDQLVRLFSRLLRTAYRSPIVEPRERDTNTPSRPDIRALGACGGEDLIDITMPHPLTPSAVLASTNPLVILRRRAREKREQHAQYAKSILGGRVVPIVLPTTGGWLPESHGYAADLVHSIHSGNRGPTHQTKSIMFQQVAALTVTANTRWGLMGARSAASCEPHANSTHAPTRTGPTVPSRPPRVTTRRRRGGGTIAANGHTT